MEDLIWMKLFFVVEEGIEGEYFTKALNYSIFTDGDALQYLKIIIKDSVKCHFNSKDLPEIIRMRFVRD